MSVRTPADPQTRPNAEGTDSLCAADHDAVADWLAHVQAGRIGNNPQMSEETRAAILANERVIRGDRRLGIW